MSGEVDLSHGFLFNEADPDEVVTFGKLNKLVTDQAARVQAGAITNREIADGIISADKLDVNVGAQLGVPDGSVTTAKIVESAVTNDKLDQMPALSAKVRKDATDGQAQDLVAAADGQFLQRKAGVLVFDSIALAGLSILARASNTEGAAAALTATADGQVLKRSGNALVFGTVPTSSQVEAIFAIKTAGSSARSAGNNLLTGWQTLYNAASNITWNGTSEQFEMGENINWMIELSVPGYGVGAHQAYIVCTGVYSGSYTLLGSSEIATVGHPVTSRSTLVAVPPVNSVHSAMKVYHYCQTANATNGGGINAGSGKDNIHAIIKFTRIG